MEKLIYLDNAATTKTSPEVVEAMLPYFTEHYGNPSSVYGFAAANKEVIAKQREIIAGVLGAKDNEIYFTAGGTEADNGLFKRMHIFLQPQPKLFQVDNGIAHQLAGTVIGDVSPTVYTIQGGTQPMQRLGVEQHVGLFAATSQGINVRMLHQHDTVGACPAFAFLLQRLVQTLLLPLPGFVVGEQPPVFNYYPAHFE